MKRIGLCVALALVAALFGTIDTANAQAVRTWISGVGDDANPCSRTAPCKTWAGAISRTAAGGEIDALDPGGFGALTITRSITLDGGGGQVASVLVAGTNGIVVAAGPNDVVIIRNLRLDGLLGDGSNAGAAGFIGINFISGKMLVVQNCTLFGFALSGINVAPTSGSVSATLFHVAVENSGSGISVAPTGSAQAWVVIKDSVVTGSSTNSVGGSTGIGILSNGAGALTTLEGTLVTHNLTGVQANASGLGFSGVLLGNSTIVNNTTGVAVVSGGKIFSYKNNNINGNGIDGSGVLTAIIQN